jgi:hypothetical protein
MPATLVCEIVGYDQAREVEPIMSPDGARVERLAPHPWKPTTLTLRLPTGETLKVQLDIIAFEQHIVPLMARAAEGQI